MKNTGIVRRIDELGRIVIPKEIRRRLKINNGDLVDISISDSNIILSKFHPLDIDKKGVDDLFESLKKIYSIDIIITDRSNIIYSSLPNLKGNDLSDVFLKRVLGYLGKELSPLNKVYLTNEYCIDKGAIIYNAMINGEWFGYLIILDNFISNKQKEIARFVLDYLNKTL